MMISMQRAQSHQGAAAKGAAPAANHAPADSHQWNLLFQVIESLAIHGLLASNDQSNQKSC
jgi:hypothetical protein